MMYVNLSRFIYDRGTNCESWFASSPLWYVLVLSASDSISYKQCRFSSVLASANSLRRHARTRDKKQNNTNEKIKSERETRDHINNVLTPAIYSAKLVRTYSFWFS